jgi:hypothetical protein
MGDIGESFNDVVTRLLEERGRGRRKAKKKKN